MSIEDGDDYKKSTELTIANNKTELLALHLDELVVNKNYKFIAEGVSGLVFKNISSLNVESKNCSIFIQSDKGIYKPGEIVKFRILALNWNLQPVILNRGQLKVFIQVN